MTPAHVWFPCPLKSDTSCATQVMAHLFLSHGTPIFESWHTDIWVMTLVCRWVTCCMCLEWLSCMCLEWLSGMCIHEGSRVVCVTRSHTYEWVTPHMWMSHGTHINEGGSVVCMSLSRMPYVLSVSCGKCTPRHWRLLSRMLYIESYVIYRVVCRWVVHVVRRWIACAFSRWVVCVYMKTLESYVSRGVTHMNESRHTCEWVTAHIWMRLLSRICQEESQPPVWSLVTSRIWIRHVTHVNASRPTCEWFMSRTWMHHNTHMNESRHTFVRIEKFTIARHVTHIKQVV